MPCAGDRGAAPSFSAGRASTPKVSSTSSRPASSRCDKPAEAVRGKPDSSLVRSGRAVAEGACGRGRRGEHRGGPRRDPRCPPPAQRFSPRHRDRSPRRTARPSPRRGGERRGPPRAPPSPATGCRSSPRRRPGIHAAARAPALDRRGAGEGQPARARGPAPLAASSIIRGQRRELELLRGSDDVSSPTDSPATSVEAAGGYDPEPARGAPDGSRRRPAWKARRPPHPARRRPLRGGSTRTSAVGVTSSGSGGWP